MTTVWATPAQMARRADDWRALAARAVEPNVFAEPDYVIPALRHLGARGVRFLLAERDGELAGVLPMRFSLWRWGVPLFMAAHYIPYAPHGTPLVVAEDAVEVCAALQAGLRAMRPTPAALLLPILCDTGPFALAWRAAAAREGRPIAAFAPFERAALIPDPPPLRGDYMTTRLSNERRKRLEQRRRRMEREIGVLTPSVAATPAEVVTALERFFAVEASGWKGRRGTAAGQSKATSAFFRESIGALGAAGRVRVVCLDLDGEAVAAGVLAQAGERIWFYKTAYDERFARHAPGVRLNLAVTDLLLADPGIAIGDSLAVTADPSLDRLWCERLPMADLLTGIAPGTSAGFTLAAKLEGWRRAARDRAKAAVNAVRERRGAAKPQAPA